MTLLQAIILGVVEGITEFLPVSSTGHLILASEILHISQTEFVKSFEIAVQVGAIAAVVFLYWKDFFNLDALKRVAIAFLPTGIIGLILYRSVKQYLLGNETVVLWALVLGGVVLIVFEYYFHESGDSEQSIKGISFRQSFLIGLFQAIAIVPGVSRAAATIIGGLLVGIKRRTIVEFSFLLAIPTMVAATALDLVKSYKVIFPPAGGSAFGGESGTLGILAVGFLTAFVVAAITIKYFLKYIQRHDFKPFGVYRIVLALVFWWFLI